MSKISEGYYNLAAREKHTILELMENHPELSKKEMAEMLGITPSCLASKQKQWGVFKRDKRGRPTVKVEDNFGERLAEHFQEKIADIEASALKTARYDEVGQMSFDESVSYTLNMKQDESGRLTPITATEVPVFHTVVKDEGEE